jgi:hypothetical protein
MATPIFSGQLNNALAQAVASGTASLENVPALRKTIIQEERWRSYTAEMSGQRMAFSTFREFALAHWPGLKSNLVDLSILCEKDPEALEPLNNEWRKGSPAFPEKIDLSEIGM